jgi:CRISPR-associated protein Cmr4
MEQKKHSAMLTFYALSPIHAGSGSATSAVDLPIQRERHTNYPHIQASAVKGAIRAHYRTFAGEDNRDQINMIFGSDEGNDGTKTGGDQTVAGAIAVSDAKLLAFPVRSNVAPFVWVTSPRILQRYHDDLFYLGKSATALPDNSVGENEAFWLQGSHQADSVLLEDAVVSVKQGQPGLPAGFPKLERLLLISDEMFEYVVTNCSEIQTQIKINEKTGTTAVGSLRYEELLPADSVLYTIVNYSQQSFAGNEFQAETIRKHVESVINSHIQIGGDWTLGRGICRINWLEVQ